MPSKLFSLIPYMTKFGSRLLCRAIGRKIIDSEMNAVSSFVRFVKTTPSLEGSSLKRKDLFSLALTSYSKVQSISLHRPAASHTHTTYKQDKNI
jgi:hypothetical protein